MKLDLATQNLEYLSFWCQVKLADTLTKQLEALTASKEGAKPDLPFEDYYRIGGAYHRAFAAVDRVRQPGEFVVVFSYHTSLKRITERRQRPSISALLECLSQVTDSLEFHCHALSLLRPDERPIVDLPFKPLRQTGLAFDEVWGVRLVKLEARKESYSAIIDQHSRTKVSLSLTFTVSEPFGPSLPQVVLTKAISIKQLFLQGK